jgi:hypothetical protein
MMCCRTWHERAPAPTTASQRPRLLQIPSFYAFHCWHDTSQRSVYYAGDKHHLNNNTCVSCSEKNDWSFCHVPFNDAQCKQLLGPKYGQCLCVRATCCATDIWDHKIGRHWQQSEGREECVWVISVWLLYLRRGRHSWGRTHCHLCYWGVAYIKACGNTTQRQPNKSFVNVAKVKYLRTTLPVKISLDLLHGMTGIIRPRTLCLPACRVKP